MNHLLFGHNEEERIVAVQQMDDRTMRLYFRDPVGTGSAAVRFRDEPFYPFFFLSQGSLLENFRRKYWIKRLDGSLFFQYLCVFEEWGAMWDAIRHILDAYNRTALTKAASYTELDILHVVSDPVSQFLMQSGRTLFKGMTFEELLRLQIDIETYTTAPHRFSNANRKGDRIILIALSDSTGWQHLIDGKKMSEVEMLRELVRVIAERDPDVIEGHNIFNFDLPYIITRATLHNVALTIGRGETLPRTFDTRTSFAEHPFEYTVTEIPGRHVIDTFLLVQSFDASKRTMESYGLKYSAQFFGLSTTDRTYIKGERIAWHWDHDVRPLMKYAMDDVTETEKLSRHLSGASFYLTRMLPVGYGLAARMGSAAKIELLMVREYLRNKHSIPRPREGAQTSGGYTDIFVVGILGPVVHADVESLYPSIMLTREIAPSLDTDRVFLSLLRELTTMRLEAKRTLPGLHDAVERSRVDAMQSSLKILINSFYGYLGYGRALFNDYGSADAVTQTGQQLLRQMIAFIQAEGGKVIEVDTDGIFFVPPERWTGEALEREFVQKLSDRMPAGITVALDGRYRKMLSYKKKNYALLAFDNKIKVKGSSLISRSMEQFGRNYLHQCIDYLLNNNIDGLHRLYIEYHHAISDHSLEARDLARVESLKESPEEYTEQVKSVKRNRSAAYEVALASARQFKAGDRVAYYITGTDPNGRVFENCKAIEEWDPNFPDENIAYYLRKLDELSEKFTDFFRPVDFRAVFSADDLFPFDPTGIALLITDVRENAPSFEEDGKADRFGIWLDEEE